MPLLPYSSLILSPAAPKKDNGTTEEPKPEEKGIKEMNKKELVAYAKEKYNLELPEEMKKDDMLAAITKEMEKEEADNEDKDDSK